MAETKVVWGIHTKQENLFMPNNIIGIGWEEIDEKQREIDLVADALKVV